jgi:RIO-like serine/threonine protein kinase
MTAPVKRLSPQNLRVLRALRAVLQREGTASIRDIAAVSGLSSSSTVAHHLNHLVLFGFVYSKHNRPRGWQLTDKGIDALQEVP